MAVRLYNEYIKVDPNFIPVFSRNSDRIYPDKWQSFYPHTSFKNILKDVVETLEKSNETKDRSIWMSGAYGTGKTYASFVIKHILEDSIDSITPYFIQNGMETLLARVKGVRAKGRILVVQRSASAGINTQDKLFNAIVESVRRAVSDAGLTYTGAESLSDKVLTILKHPETSAFNFQGAFNKYRGKFTEYSSVDSIVKDLEELDLEDKLSLLDTIIEVAALEGFNWSMSSEDIVDWLEDVRKGNNLSSIVFIWDEFTEYFKNNQNNITGLQEIAQASSRISCYLFLITHSSAGQLIQDKGSKSIIEARFKLDTIELEESTAFKLLGQALRHEVDLADEWKHTSEQLWDGVKRGSVDVIKNKDYNIQDDDFRALLPMHPYAAYLLKFIAKDISSNQRTIFQFLSGDYSGDEDKTNFKWFIEHFAFEYGKWNYLTADYLWDYFFKTSNVDLDAAFIQTISHYNNFAPLCDDPSGGSISRAKMFYDISKRTQGLVSRYDYVAFDEIQSIKFTDAMEMQGALKGYLESGEYRVGDSRGVGDAGLILLGNIDSELMDVNQNMFKDLPDIFHESALLDRFHGFIKGWNIPKMKESLKANGWALNTEYFGEIMHYLRDELAYRAVVDQLLQLPKNSATRDTEAIKRICTGYLKLLFPNATDVSKVDVSLFETYCLAPAMEMRRVIKTQLGIIDEGEFGGMTIPEITIKEQYREK